MTNLHTPAYAWLHRQQERLHRLDHLQSIAAWDQATHMPPGGNEARSAALAELATLMHRDRADPSLAARLAAARQEPLDDWQAANLREIERAWQRTQAVPEALVEWRTLVTSQCEHAWRSQRPRNDWAGFAANLREVLALVRQEARCLGDALGLSPYDALLDHYEPGMRSAEVARLFGDRAPMAAGSDSPGASAPSPRRRVAPGRPLCPAGPTQRVRTNGALVGF